MLVSNNISLYKRRKKFNRAEVNQANEEFKINKAEEFSESENFGQLKVFFKNPQQPLEIEPKEILEIEPKESLEIELKESLEFKDSRISNSPESPDSLDFLDSSRTTLRILKNEEFDHLQMTTSQIQDKVNTVNLPNFEDVRNSDFGSGVEQATKELYSGVTNSINQTLADLDENQKKELSIISQIGNKLGEQIEEYSDSIKMCREGTAVCRKDTEMVHKSFEETVEQVNNFSSFLNHKFLIAGAVLFVLGITGYVILVKSDNNNHPMVDPVVRVGDLALPSKLVEQGYNNVSQTVTETTSFD